MPTSRFLSFGGVSPSSASDRSVGPILAAQPQVRARLVRVFFFKKFMWDLLPGLQCYGFFASHPGRDGEHDDMSNLFSCQILWLMSS